MSAGPERTLAPPAPECVPTSSLHSLPGAPALIMESLLSARLLLPLALLLSLLAPAGAASASTETLSIVSVTPSTVEAGVPQSVQLVGSGFVQDMMFYGPGLSFKDVVILSSTSATALLDASGVRTGALDVTADRFDAAAVCTSCVTVAAVPDKVSSLTILPIGAGALTLVWKSLPGSVVTAYVVSVDGVETVLPASARSHAFTGLSPTQAYTFAVWGRNALGDGPSFSVVASPPAPLVSQLSVSVSGTRPAVLRGQLAARSGEVSPPLPYETVQVWAQYRVLKRSYFSRVRPTRWVRIATVHTNDDGAFSHPLPPGRPLSYQVRYLGRNGAPIAGIPPTTPVTASFVLDSSWKLRRVP